MRPLPQTSALLDWLAWQSTLQRRVNEDQQWAFLKYMPVVAAAAHTLVAADTKPRYREQR